MKPSDLSAHLPQLIGVSRPVFIWGPPGLGKSAIVRQIAKTLKRGLTDVRTVLLDPVDLRGLPRVTAEGRAQWCPPSFLPSDPESRDIIFLDELPQAPQMTQAACLQLVLDRRIGEYQMPPGCVVIAAGNRQQDRAGAHRVITPLLNRFVHIDLELSVDDWQAWALGAGIDQRIRSFIAWKPGALFKFEPASMDRSFPTPRSWEFVGDVLRGMKDLNHDIIAGCIGGGAAGEFMAFCELYGQLPDPAAILARPDSHDVPGEPSVLYALCGAILDHLRKHPALAGAYATYAGRMPPEFGVLAMRDAPAVAPQILQTPEGSAWLRANRDALIASRT